MGGVKGESEREGGGADLDRESTATTGTTVRMYSKGRTTACLPTYLPTSLLYLDIEVPEHEDERSQGKQTTERPERTAQSTENPSPAWMKERAEPLETDDQI